MTAKPTKRQRDAMLRDMDLLPKEQASKRADALLQAMLATPPDPYTPKPKKTRRRAK